MLVAQYMEPGSDASGHLIIVTRQVGDREVVSVVNTSVDNKVAIPAKYQGWNAGAHSGVSGNELEPLGYFFASR